MFSSSIISTLTALCWLCCVVLGYSEMNESASRAWLPGAMVEVEIVKPILQTNAGEDARLFDLWVEVKEVFTGPQSIKGTYISINPHLAFRFPPSSWSAYGMGGIAGGSIEDFPAGRRGLLWIFQRSELLTGTGQGMEFRFFTGFTPVWMPREEDAADALEKWEETRSMMQILKTLEDLDDAGKSNAVSKLLQHPNAVVREWALAALARVQGVDVIHLLETAQSSELVSERIKEFLLGAGASLTPPLSDHPPKISVEPLLGVEVMTKEKRSASGGLVSPARVIEPGTVKVLRVFSGSGLKEDAILPAETGDFEVGTKFLVAVRESRVTLDKQDSNTVWNFPPQGLWDGNNKRLGSFRYPELDLEPILPWLQKITIQGDSEGMKFLNEAVKNAPLIVAYWAIRTHPSLPESDTMNGLKNSLGFDSDAAGSDPSLRNMFLYDVAMSRTFGKLWAWDESRDLLMERILSHPLANQEEAWLLHEILIRYWDFSGAAGTPEKWTRLAKAARENSSWKKEWIDPRCRRQFELSAWLCTWMASRATFDASPAVDYLLERWAIPDRDSDSTATYVDGRGAQLANSLPLKPEQVEKLRAELTVRLAASGEAPSPENLKNMMEGIRVLTWDEILRISK